MRLQATVWLTAVLLYGGLPAQAQEVAHTAAPTVIRSETRLVLVDAVVTDKKGNYVADLAQKNFKLYDDNKEQPITSFSYEADANSPNNNQKRYLVLFFDNASVTAGDQMSARAAAQKFVAANTGPAEFIAVVNFSGTLKITQNFTNDPDRLKAAISGVKFSAVSTTDDGASSPSIPGLPSLSASANFGVRSVLLGLRSLAKGLEQVPGRKSLVMLTAGFALTPEVQSELTATVAACNRSNVSVYPIDVRGLTVPGMGVMREDPPLPMARVGWPAGPARGLFRVASFSNSFAPQARGGGGVGSGGATGGGAAPGASAGSAGASAGSAAGGSRGGGSSPVAPSGGVNPGGNSGGSRGAPGGNAPGVNGGRFPGNNPGGNNPGRGGAPTNPAMNPSMNNRNINNPRSIVPDAPFGADPFQSALYMLAEGTGGFVIINSNDLLGGMEKIAREQNQYYIIGFSPAESGEGTCHTLRLKLDRGGTNLRSRSGYCNVRQIDVLAGKPAERELESIAAGVATGALTSPLQLPFFYASPNVARVNVAMEIPSKSFKFEKVKGKQHAEMNVLGVAYRPDGSVGARFSDTVKLEYESKSEIEEFVKKPLHYESQFDIATGQYNFKVVFSAGGENFGKLEKPLLIEPFDGKQFTVSSLALSRQLQKTSLDMGLDSVLLEDRVPLVALGMQVIPAASYDFKTSDSVGMYLEIFDPGLTDEKPPELGIQVRVVDRKTSEQKMASGTMALAKYIRAGNPLIPVVLALPIKDLKAGSYRVEVTGLNSLGKSMMRAADFEIQ